MTSSSRNMTYWARLSSNSLFLLIIWTFSYHSNKRQGDNLDIQLPFQKVMRWYALMCKKVHLPDVHWHDLALPLCLPILSNTMTDDEAPLQCKQTSTSHLTLMQKHNCSSTSRLPRLISPGCWSPDILLIEAEFQPTTPPRSALQTSQLVSGRNRAAWVIDNNPEANSYVANPAVKWARRTQETQSCQT
jgi:hypothetical protein